MGGNGLPSVIAYRKFGLFVCRYHGLCFTAGGNTLGGKPEICLVRQMKNEIKLCRPGPIY